MPATYPGSASNLTIAPFADDARWDAFLRDAPGATFCHLAAWRAIMADVLGHEVLARAALRDDGSIAGVLHLVRMKSRLFGHQLISMPFLNYGGPAGSPQAQSALANWAAEEAQRSRADTLELRSRHPLPDGTQLEPTQHKLTVLLEMPQQPDELWSRFTSKLRSQIRRPQKEGMHIRFGMDQVPAFYDVFRRNMRDLGTPVHPRAFFERLPQHFPDNVVFGVVYLHDVPVAAGCGFIWNNEFEITWASAHRDYTRMAPNMLLYWEFMRMVMDRGARVFNFGRCSPGSSTHRFKLQWSGQDEPLGWARWERTTRTAPSGDSRMFAMASAAWSHLPLPIANILGPIVSRRIAAF